MGAAFFFWTVFMLKQGERMGIFTVKRKKKIYCKLFCWPQSLPRSPAFSKEDSSSPSHVHSLRWLLHRVPILRPYQPWCCAACAGCPQGVPQPWAPARTSHRHMALMEVDCCTSVSNAHNEISIWIELIKLPVALNPGCIRCKWTTINFAPFLRALYMHSQHRKNCSGDRQGSLSLTMTWRNHTSIFS